MFPLYVGRGSEGSPASSLNRAELCSDDLDFLHQVAYVLRQGSDAVECAFQFEHCVDELDAPDDEARDLSHVGLKCEAIHGR